MTAALIILAVAAVITAAGSIFAWYKYDAAVQRFTDEIAKIKEQTEKEE